MFRCFVHFLLLVLSLKLTSHVFGLQCWHCVGYDCDDGVESSKFSYKQECEEGAMCQKTFMYELDLTEEVTRRSLAVRSCGFPEDCYEHDETQDYHCQLWNWKFEAGLGCTQRWCCNNTDLCNGATRMGPTQSTYTLIANLLIVLLVCFCFSK